MSFPPCGETRETREGGRGALGKQGAGAREEGARLAPRQDSRVLTPTLRLGVHSWVQGTVQDPGGSW